MLKTKPRKKSRKNPNSKDEKEKARQREIADFIAVKGVKKYPYDKQSAVSYRPGTGTRLKERQSCELCGSWTDTSNEYRHYDWCPTYKTSRKNPTKRLVRKNPISTRKSSKQYGELIQLDIDQTSRSHIILNYKGKEIEFTGKDAEELRDIMKYQLKLFRESSRLQKLYPGNLDNSGGYDTYITEILKDIYPKVFK